MFKKYIGIKPVLLYVCLILSACVFNACKDDEEGSNGTTQLLSFGPSPVLRGGEIRFIGNRLDKVTAIALPGNVEVTTFKVKTKELIIIDVPEETISGEVVLRTPDGNFATKTELEISEPIEITSFSPAKARPGDILTINGEYLNLIEEVYFAKDVKVTDFESHSKTKIEVKIPANAQTGPLIFSNGEEEPILLETKSPMDITLPVVSQISPNPVKAGQQITITGTDLDLTNRIVFGGEKSVNAFVSKTATTIEVIVPADAKNGKIKLVALSNAGLESGSELTLIEATLSSITPNPTANNRIITVTGVNLDLVDKVTFTGNKDGEIQSGRTATQIQVKIPSGAVTGKVNFYAKSGKPVTSSQDLELVAPTITSIAPLSVNTVDNPVITITGTDLDNADTIVFGGVNWKASIDKAISVSQTEIKMRVVPGGISGKIKIINKNGVQVTSSETLTIVPDVPNIPIMPATAYIGSYVTIDGTNMDVASEIIFPGDLKATSIGSKTSTKLVVLVPNTVAPGKGKIKFLTSKNEIYESPETTFKFPGTEPVQNVALMINDFDETGHDLGWDNWNSLVELGNDLSIGISGKYLHGNSASATGWKWFWACNHDGLKKVSVTKADHLVKMDIRITKAISSNVNFQMQLSGNTIDLGNLGGSTPNGGWVTITYDLSTFGSLPATIPASGTWGMVLQNGTNVDLTGIYIDNIRFHKK